MESFKKRDPPKDPWLGVRIQVGAHNIRGPWLETSRLHGEARCGVQLGFRVVAGVGFGGLGFFRGLAVDVDCPCTVYL